MGLIYMRVSPSGGKYIGQTIREEKIRWKEHCKDANNPNNERYNSILSKAIRKYGAENFTVYILEDNITKEELNKNLIYQTQKLLRGFKIYDDEDIKNVTDIYLTQKKNPSKQAKITNALLPVVQGYNNLNQEQRYQFRKLLRSFVKCYNFISQIIRMFSKELHREYLFCKYLERLVPADPVTMIDITNKIKLEYYKLEKTFDGGIELKTENGVLEPQRIKNTPGEKEKKTPLSEVIKKINEEFGTKFTERDKVIFEDVFNTMVKDDKLKTSARSNGQQMFENNIMPKSFDDTLQNSYLENMEAYESWLKDKEKYNFMRKMMAEALYKAFLKEEE